MCSCIQDTTPPKNSSTQNCKCHYYIRTLFKMKTAAFEEFRAQPLTVVIPHAHSHNYIRSYICGCACLTPIEFMMCSVSFRYSCFKKSKCHSVIKQARYENDVQRVSLHCFCFSNFIFYYLCKVVEKVCVFVCVNFKICKHNIWTLQRYFYT